MNTLSYPSDLTDAEWAILAPLITPGKQAGHPQVLELRRVVDAVFYLLHTGCPWRALPHEFPSWPSVFYHYAKRHILADTEGTLLKARVHPADIHSLPTGLTRGTGAVPSGCLRASRQRSRVAFTCSSGGHVLKRRWVVERTFAWLGRNRRMSRDYERLIETAAMLLYAAMARVTLRRLAEGTQ